MRQVKTGTRGKNRRSRNAGYTYRSNPTSIDHLLMTKLERRLRKILHESTGDVEPEDLFPPLTWLCRLASRRGNFEPQICSINPHIFFLSTSIIIFYAFMPPRCPVAQLLIASIKVPTPAAFLAGSLHSFACIKLGLVSWLGFQFRAHLVLYCIFWENRLESST